ncbi:Uncharacterised protein [Mycobacteroides abscessus subsp. abscessus]|nr:Uncharacterised protein [Mycobacteroides abscessus subsp. abscessus]
MPGCWSPDRSLNAARTRDLVDPPVPPQDDPPSEGTPKAAADSSMSPRVRKAANRSVKYLLSPPGNEENHSDPVMCTLMGAKSSLRPVAEMSVDTWHLVHRSDVGGHRLLGLLLRAPAPRLMSVHRSAHPPEQPARVW